MNATAKPPTDDLIIQTSYATESYAMTYHRYVKGEIAKDEFGVVYALPLKKEGAITKKDIDSIANNPPMSFIPHPSITDDQIDAITNFHLYFQKEFCRRVANKPSPLSFRDLSVPTTTGHSVIDEISKTIQTHYSKTIFGMPVILDPSLAADEFHIIKR